MIVRISKTARNDMKRIKSRLERTNIAKANEQISAFVDIIKQLEKPIKEQKDIPLKSLVFSPNAYLYIRSTDYFIFVKRSGKNYYNLCRVLDSRQEPLKLLLN